MRKISYCFAAVSMMLGGDVANVFGGVRYVYVQPVQQNQNLDGVERVVRDMAALRQGTAPKALPSDSYHQDLDARLRVLEAKNKVTPRPLGSVGAAVVTELAVSAAVDILGALNLNKNSSDQDKAQAILQALIPHIQQAQQNAAANAAPQNATPAIPGTTQAEVEFVLALKAFRTAAENAQKDSEKRKEFQDAQKKALDELITTLKKISP